MAEREGFVASLKAMDNKARAIWGGVMFLSLVMGFSGRVVAGAVDGVRWFDKIESRVAVVEEGNAEIPGIKGEVLVLKETVKDGHNVRNLIQQKIEKLADGQYRITLRVERLDERTGGMK